jgi:Fur family zinc uptake transcriptional regulator/Fur family ferric uptake transcriptional regulator
LGLPTIYRILEELSSIGVLVSVVSDERLLSYALCSKPQAHHHHFICRSCKKIEEVDYCGLADAEKTIQKKLGCRIDSHLFQVEGVCGACLKKSKKEPVYA